MKKKFTPVVLLLLLLSCTDKKLDKKIILQINNVKVTSFELKKEANRNFNNNTEIQDKESIIKFKKDFLNKYIIITDAYSKHYDTIEEVKKNVKHISDLMMTQQDSYLWNEQAAPLVEEFKKITPEKIKKRSKILYCDYVKIEDKNKFLELRKNDTIIENIKEFYRLKKACANFPFLSTEYLSLQWPYQTFYNLANSLDKMQSGQISGLLHSKGFYYYFYIHSTENIKVTPEDEDLLSFQLQFIKEEMINETKHKEMLQKGNPQINHVAVNSIYDHLQTGMKLSSYAKNDTVLKYYLNDKQKTVTFNDFYDTYKYYPFLPAINSKEELVDRINQYYFTKYLSDEAQKLGLFKNEKFLLEQENYKNNIIYDTYINKEIVRYITVDSSEVIDYYKNNKEKHKAPKYIIADCYFFDTDDEATENWYIFSDFYRNNSPFTKINRNDIKNLKYTLFDIKIDNEDYSDFIPEDHYKIRDLRPGFVSYSVAFKGKYALILNKKEEEYYIKPFEEVFDEIKYMLWEEEIKKALLVRAKELGEIYTPSINKINMQKL